MGFGFALFWGFIIFFDIFLISGAIFEMRVKPRLISAIIAGIAAFMFVLLDLKTPLTILTIVSFGLTLLVVLVFWISGRLK